MRGIEAAPGAARPLGPESENTRLKKAVTELQGVFVEQLFKAMRESVPEGGLVDGGNGEEMFTGLMDQHLAAQVPAGWESGLGAALYRQLRGDVASGGPAAVTNGSERLKA